MKRQIAVVALLVIGAVASGADEWFDALLSVQGRMSESQVLSVLGNPAFGVSFEVQDVNDGVVTLDYTGSDFEILEYPRATFDGVTASECQVVLNNFGVSHISVDWHHANPEEALAFFEAIRIRLEPPIDAKGRPEDSAVEGLPDVFDRMASGVIPAGEQVTRSDLACNPRYYLTLRDADVTLLLLYPN
jgi:hypothetical protein